MTLWQKLQNTLEEPRRARDADPGLLRELQNLARRERRSPDEVILSLLQQGVEARRAQDRAHRCWESLSPREKQVTALVCRGLTSRQVAARLVISPQTVKTHVRHILRKFSLPSRRELREQLAGWDLGSWEEGVDRSPC